ncbi:GNAT family N-acetyltransferase [Kluyvera cryocrescens]|uniref:GNAT family N-acetyltransferase n=1 Tax=Kluyvera cryocrescens TaxID=580 RepID=UPI0007742B0D|nr:GNAT family N-acetyltransferase [Kluyvera cryocrescens]
MAILTTARLQLSPFDEHDWSFFLSLRQNPEVMRFMGEVLDEAAIREIFAQRCNEPGIFVIRDQNGTALGDIGLRISHKNPHEADIGYALLPQAQSQGYASEALDALCDYGFHQLSLWAINAWVLGDNHGSARLLEKRGFIRTQVLEKAYQLNGEYFDDWVYRLENAPTAK